jgi:hypothetical protein
LETARSGAWRHEATPPDGSFSGSAPCPFQRNQYNPRPGAAPPKKEELMECHSKRLSFKMKGETDARHQTLSFTFSAPIKHACVMLRGFAIRYDDNDDQSLFEEGIWLDDPIILNDQKTVHVEVHYVLRNNEDFDHPYSGYVDVVALGLS